MRALEEVLIAIAMIIVYVGIAVALVNAVGTMLFSLYMALNCL